MEMSYPPKILHVGDFALFPKTVSASDVTLFAGVSGDMNPLYLNETYGQHSSYKMRLVPSMLIASMMGGAVNRLLRPSSCPVERRFSVKADAGGRHPYDPRRGQGDRRRKRAGPRGADRLQRRR